MVFRGVVWGAFALTFVACSTTPQYSSLLRKPSSDEDQVEMIRSYIQRLLAVDRKPNQVMFKVHRFPPTGYSDISSSSGGSAAAVVIDQTQKELQSGVADSLFDYSSEESGEDRDLRVDAVLAEVRKDLSYEDRVQFASICTSGARTTGDQVRLASLVKPWQLCQKLKGLFTQAEMREALLAFPEKPKKVKYDGDLGYHVYQDQKLELMVKMLSVSINWDRARFAEVYRDLPEHTKQIFAKDKDGLSDADKVEPFDLLSTMTTGMIMGKMYGRDLQTNLSLNKIQVSKMSQKALSRLFGMFDRDSDHITRNPSISLLRSDSNISVFCANGFFETDQYQGVSAKGTFRTAWNKTLTGTDLVETWTPFYDMPRLRSEGIQVLPFICNANSYRFAFRMRPAETIPEPAELNFSNANELNALMTISLVSEIDRSAVEKGRFLISKLGGWTIDEDLKEVNTNTAFREAFNKVDAYIPVMHAMDVNYFNIGTGESLSLKLSRKVKDKNGVSRTLRLTVLFPLGSSKLSHLVMGPTELAQILDDRYQQKKTPLFLMNNSCASEKTLPAWSLVYRKAFELRKARGEVQNLSQVTDFPHIIGSKRYFATSSVAQIFGHAEYPLKSLEMLTAGQSVSEIVSFLEQPPSKGFLGTLTSLISGDSGETMDSANRGFEPEYSGRNPELRSFGGFEIVLSGRGIKGENVY